MAKSKYVMSRMSIHLKKMNVIETTTNKLLSMLMNREVSIIIPVVIYFNNNKTKGLVYSGSAGREFNFVTQNELITKKGTIYNKRYLTNKEGFEMLNMNLRAEKLKKIKKKIKLLNG